MASVGPAGRGHFVNFAHVNFQVVGPLKDLPALSAWVRHKASLVLVPHVPEERALEVEAPAALGAPELDRALRGLAQGVDVVLLRIVQPLQPRHGVVGGPGGGVSGCGRGGC